MVIFLIFGAANETISNKILKGQENKLPLIRKFANVGFLVFHNPRHDVSRQSWADFYYFLRKLAENSPLAAQSYLIMKTKSCGLDNNVVNNS